MSGFEALGDMLGGGQTVRNDAAYQNGRYRSAQTEDALTNAAVNRAKAQQVAAQNDANTALAAMQAKGGVDYTNPTSDMITQAILGGHGSDLPSAGKFNLDAQQYRNRDAITDPNSSNLQRLRAAEGVEGKIQSPIAAVGSHGYVDLTAETPELSVMAGLGGAEKLPSAHIQDYGFRHQLPPAEQAVFDALVRGDHYTNAGGVTYATPGVNPSHVTPPGFPGSVAPPAPPAPVVPLATVANNAATVAQAKKEGDARGVATAGAPNKAAAAERMLDNITKLTSSPAFDQIYGVQGAVDPRNYLPGTAGMDAKILRTGLNSQAFENAMEQLRGLGSMSNIEGEGVRNAFTLATQPGQSPESAKANFALLQTRLKTQIDKAHALLDSAALPQPGAQPNAATAPRSFASEAEAQAAGLKPGDRVVIGGVSGTWE